MADATLDTGSMRGVIENILWATSGEYVLEADLAPTGGLQESTLDSFGARAGRDTLSDSLPADWKGAYIAWARRCPASAARSWSVLCGYDMPSGAATENRRRWLLAGEYDGLKAEFRAPEWGRDGFAGAGLFSGIYRFLGNML